MCYTVLVHAEPVFRGEDIEMMRLSDGLRGHLASRQGEGKEGEEKSQDRQHWTVTFIVNDTSKKTSTSRVTCLPSMSAHNSAAVE